MRVKKDINSCIRKYVENRLYWLLGIIVFIMIAFPLGGVFFSIGCIPLNSVRGRAYLSVIMIVILRMLIGFALGENKKKIVTYLILPFVLVAEIIIIASIMGFNG